METQFIVINNQSTFADQPREIGDFKCAQHTDGSYQWHFHNYPMTDVGFACQADVDSCSCPRITVDEDSGAKVRERFMKAPDQCSLYAVHCETLEYSDDDLLPLLYSKDTVINNGAVLSDTFYDDLICIKEDSNVFNWYYSNKKLEDVSIKCNSKEEDFNAEKVCTCGAFPVINRIEMLGKYKYYQTKRYIGGEVGESSWTPSCKFKITCEEEFKGVVFSDNYDPIELSEIYVTCTYNPLSNDLRIWIVNSVRVINPAGGCFKKR
ncbi:hypothetical protein CAEBREN_25795 [Caenorhabditis brenneri]|uniref:Uncharacterized protein n=1 Tax=Caenorhabditis brenneri TaxID=135651 RepID=G0NEJ6_CAEBE|nr:hypothetical protein CAEBREN_25795 [Caenorhabditis brenneri]